MLFAYRVSHYLRKCKLIDGLPKNLPNFVERYIFANTYIVAVLPKNFSIGHRLKIENTFLYILGSITNYRTTGNHVTAHETQISTNVQTHLPCLH